MRGWHGILDSLGPEGGSFGRHTEIQLSFNRNEAAEEQLSKLCSDCLRKESNTIFLVAGIDLRSASSPVVNSSISMLEADLIQALVLFPSGSLSLNWLFLCQAHFLGFIYDDFFFNHGCLLRGSQSVHSLPHLHFSALIRAFRGNLDMPLNKLG